ncbi:hypothetical protein ENBRE01_1009 [Enteropsectra breve]|nr:hypothetical protein ENBRE01_1009 [Enteropsectra breve]
MRVSDLFAVCFATSTATFEQESLQPKYMSPEQKRIDKCFSHVLEELKLKKAITDHDYQQNTLKLISQKEHTARFELCLKEGLASENMPVLRFFCDCFLYDIKTTDGALAHHGKHDNIPCDFMKDECSQCPTKYLAVFKTNFSSVLENNSSSIHRGASEEASKNTIKYWPASHYKPLGDKTKTNKTIGRVCSVLAHIYYFLLVGAGLPVVFILLMHSFAFLWQKCVIDFISTLGSPCG